MVSNRSLTAPIIEAGCVTMAQTHLACSSFIMTCSFPWASSRSSWPVLSLAGRGKDVPKQAGQKEGGVSADGKHCRSAGAAQITLE